MTEINECRVLAVRPSVCICVCVLCVTLYSCCQQNFDVKTEQNINESIAARTFHLATIGQRANKIIRTLGLWMLFMMPGKWNGMMQPTRST